MSFHVIFTIKKTCRHTHKAASAYLSPYICVFRLNVNDKSHIGKCLVFIVLFKEMVVCDMEMHFFYIVCVLCQIKAN